MARIVPNTQFNDLENILLQEGIPSHASGVFDGTITGSNQSNIFNAFKNTASPYIFLKNKACITSNKDVTIFCSIDGDFGNNLAISNLANFFIPAGGHIFINWDTPMYPQGVQFSLAGDSSQSGTAVKIGIVNSSVRLINDLNFNAAGKIFWMGDSITDFTANSQPNNSFYQFRVRDYLSKNSTLGKDYRLTQKASGGRTSVHFDNMLNYGSLYQETPSFIFYQLGVNDASTAVGTSTYTANINNLIRYKQCFWKDSYLIFLGSTPVQQNARETTLDTYRTAMANAVTAAADSKVKYISLASAYDRTATPSTIWATSDNPTVNTDCIHPGTVLAHTGIANAIIDAMIGQNIPF